MTHPGALVQPGQPRTSALVLTAQFDTTHWFRNHVLNIEPDGMDVGIVVSLIEGNERHLYDPVVYVVFSRVIGWGWANYFDDVSEE